MIARPSRAGASGRLWRWSWRDGTRIVTADAAGTVHAQTVGPKLDAGHAYQFRAEVSALAATPEGQPVVGFGGGDVWR